MDIRVLKYFLTIVREKTTLTDSGMLLRRRAVELVKFADKTEREFLSKDEKMVFSAIKTAFCSK